MSDPQFDEDLDLGEVLLAILGEWRTVLLVLAATLGLAGLYAFVLAPTEYRAETTIRGVPTAFCPVGVTCASSLEESVSRAASIVNSDQAYGRLDAELRLSTDEYFLNDRDENPAVKARRRFLEAVDIDASGQMATIQVRHESEVRAVEIANAIGAVIRSEIALDAQASLDATARSLALQLARLSAPAETERQTAGLIAIERAALAAQVENLDQIAETVAPVSLVDRVAELPAERTAPRRALIVAMGGIFGLFLGAGFAALRAARRGRLYTIRAVGSAFGVDLPLTASAHAITEGAAQRLWQDVRVVVGDADTPVIALSGPADPKLIRQAAVGLCEEFARSGPGAGIVDLGGWFERSETPSDLGDEIVPAQAGAGITAYACDGDGMQKAISALTDRGCAVILLAPSAERDLPLMRKSFLVATARVVLALRGQATRQDLARIMRAERGATGARVLAVV